MYYTLTWPRARSVTEHTNEIEFTSATEQTASAGIMKLAVATGNWINSLLLNTPWLTGGKGRLSFTAMLTWVGRLLTIIDDRLGTGL